MTPMLVNLSSFEPIETLASLLVDRGANVDVILNSARYWPRGGKPVNGTGLKPSFASMHLGHFHLTELLLGENPCMRVVNTSSIAHHLGALMTLLHWPGRLGQRPGCPDNVFFWGGAQSPLDGSRAYLRAKLTNPMCTMLRCHGVIQRRQRLRSTWGGWALPSFRS